MSNFDKKDIIELADELHKPVIRNFLRRKLIFDGIDSAWAADLVDMKDYEKENKGFKYLLTVIDGFSRYAWAVPLKNKEGKTVLDAIKKIIKESKRTPKNLYVDKGSEFYNKNVMDFLEKNNIGIYSTFSEFKASIIERFNRTLKTKMWKYFTTVGSYKWTDILPILLNDYNKTVHSAIKTTPIEASNPNNEHKLYKQQYGPTIIEMQKKTNPKFKLGDKVRISRIKGIFEKGYLPNWSAEIFTVVEIDHRYPILYKLVDYENKPIKGSFYEQELQKSKVPDVYLVEEVMGRRYNKATKQYEREVKWKGFNKKHNSWIPENDIDNLTI